jgi:predicted DNA-binding transcriptional regulator YafY
MKNYKYKILKVLNILIKKSDENHPISTNRIIDELAVGSIEAERKSIYNDIDVLRQQGIEIIYTTKPKPGYYIVDYTYSLTEIKLLTDIVSYSSFLSNSQSNNIIEKLLKNVSLYNEDIIKKQLYYSKSKNIANAGFYGIENILHSIDQNRVIEFKYFDLDDKKNKIYRNKTYKYLPKALIYNNNKYYLIAYSFNHKSLTHFRVDKMDSIEIKEIININIKNVNNYIDTNFSMYAGTKENITLRVKKDKLNLIYDFVNTSIIFTAGNDPKNYYYVNFDISTSKVFIGYLYTVSDAIKIIKPQSLINKMCLQSKEILEIYKGE